MVVGERHSGPRRPEASELENTLQYGYYSHMKRASITEAKNGLSALIDRVRHGETVIIEDRGVPVARLESVGPDERGRSEGRLARLERQGLARRPLSRPPLRLIASAPPSPVAGRSLSAALIDERNESR